MIYDSLRNRSICVAAIYALPFKLSRNAWISLPINSIQLISIFNILDRHS